MIATIVWLKAATARENLLDRLIMWFFMFFNWPVTGLGKSVLDYPDVHPDRIGVLLLSSWGLLAQLVGGYMGFAYPGSLNWWYVGPLMLVYCVLTFMRFGVYASRPLSVEGALG